MAGPNNVRIPDELLSQLDAVARAQGKAADELLAEAARTYLEHKALDDLAARGRVYSERAGHPDPVEAVQSVRRER